MQYNIVGQLTFEDTKFQGYGGCFTEPLSFELYNHLLLIIIQSSIAYNSCSSLKIYSQNILLKIIFISLKLSHFMVYHNGLNNTNTIQLTI